MNVILIIFCLLNIPVCYLYNGCTDFQGDSLSTEITNVY